MNNEFLNFDFFVYLKIDINNSNIYIDIKNQPNIRLPKKNQKNQEMVPKLLNLDIHPWDIKSFKILAIRYLKWIS